MKSRWQYRIYLNDKFQDICDGTKEARRDWIRRNLLDTHMGTWNKRTDNTIEYNTTIGRYYEFRPELI